MNKKMISLIALLLLLVLIGFSVLDIQSSKDEYKTEKQEYYKEGFSGILISKRVNRGIRIKLQQNDKELSNYLYSSKNYDYTPNNLYDFLIIGDSLVKIDHSLDLYIYRADKKYYFKLGEYIND